jgi:3-dehydroquinate synthase
MIDVSIIPKIRSTLESAGLPVKLTGFDVHKVYDTMFHDKKVKDGKLTFVLPKDIGEVIRCNLDDEELIKAVLSELLE